MKDKKLIIILVAFVVLVALMVGVYFLTRPKTQDGEKTITVTVVHGSGESKDFTYQTDEEYLGPVILGSGLVEGEMGQFGLYIKVVDGEQAIYEVDNAYWSLYVGEEMAMQGADLTPIVDGGVYKLVYTGA